MVHNVTQVGSLPHAKMHCILLVLTLVVGSKALPIPFLWEAYCTSSCKHETFNVFCAHFVMLELVSLYSKLAQSKAQYNIQVNTKSFNFKRWNIKEGDKTGMDGLMLPW